MSLVPLAVLVVGGVLGCAAGTVAGWPPDVTDAAGLSIGRLTGAVPGALVAELSADEVHSIHDGTDH